MAWHQGADQSLAQVVKEVPTVSDLYRKRGVGLDLGAVDGHVAQLHQTGLGAQLQRLHKQTRQRCQVPLAELRQCAVILMLIGRQKAKRHVVIGLGLDLARTVNPGRIPHPAFWTIRRC